MLSDKNFAAGKPSENNISKKIIKDLLVPKSLLEEKSLSDEDNLNIKKWAKLNKSALASSSPDLLHVII
jgi:hypothetical protein